MLLDNIKTSLEKRYDMDTGINMHDYLCEGDKAPVNDGSVNVLFDPEKNGFIFEHSITSALFENSGR